MVYGQLDLQVRLEHKEYDLIIKDEYKSLIRFHIHPNSVCEKTWFTESENPETKCKILHHITQPITGNNFFQVEKEMLYTTESINIFTDFFSNVPAITSDDRNQLANHVISESRNIITSNKSAEISVEIKASTMIRLNEKDMQVVDKYDRYYAHTIPASRSSIAALERVGNCSPNGDICSICWDKDLEGSKVIRLQCSHEFHAKCIVEWLEKSRRCPLCRFEMPSCLFEELFDVC